MVTRNFPRQLLYTYALHPISSYACVCKQHIIFHWLLFAIFYVSSTPFLKNEYDFIVKGLKHKLCDINIYVCYPKHVAILELFSLF